MDRTLHLGIDEAGYGPLLGPLVVAGTAFSAPDCSVADSDGLWGMLNEAICRQPASKDPRLAIADSKKLYNRSAGLASLEKAALVMLAATERKPSSLAQLMTLLAGDDKYQANGEPWYRGYDCHLPTCISPQSVALQANAVRRCLSDRQVELRGIWIEVMPAGSFNRLISKVRNKATVLSGLALRLVARAIASYSDQPLRVTIDRQGGRTHYGQQLMTFFEGAQLKVREESANRSAYSLTYNDRVIDIEFITGGEEHAMPVALASIYAKYVRELFMNGINAYFSRQVPGLKSTAGYYTDAQRFLADVAPVINRDGFDRNLLVRCR